jgi:hypothetical protein
MYLESVLKNPLGWETFHLKKQKKFFFSLPVIASPECSVFFSPWGQNVPKCMIGSGKIGDRNQVLTVFPFLFVCGFLR